MHLWNAKICQLLSMKFPHNLFAIFSLSFPTLIGVIFTLGRVLLEWLLTVVYTVFKPDHLIHMGKQAAVEPAGPFPHMPWPIYSWTWQFELWCIYMAGNAKIIVMEVVGRREREREEVIEWWGMRRIWRERQMIECDNHDWYKLLQDLLRCIQSLSILQGISRYGLREALGGFRDF